MLVRRRTDEPVVMWAIRAMNQMRPCRVESIRVNPAVSSEIDDAILDNTLWDYLPTADDNSVYFMCARIIVDKRVSDGDMYVFC